MIAGTANGWDAVIAVCTLGGIVVNAALAFRNGRKLRTPSGDPIGRVVERTHAISAATVALVTKLNGAHGELPKDKP